MRLKLWGMMLLGFGAACLAFGFVAANIAVWTQGPISGKWAAAAAVNGVTGFVSVLIGAACIEAGS